MASSGSLVASSLETAGITIQSEVLTWVAGDGMYLAGLLYLIGLVSAFFVVSSGGKYLWARYLLIGPALFLAATQIGYKSDGSEWKFADELLPAERQAAALKDTQLDGGGQVALVFGVWNEIMSGITQELISLLNLTEDNGHLNFLAKVDRYLDVERLKIRDPHLKQLVRLVMINECSEYYIKKMVAARPQINDPDKDGAVKWLAENENRKVLDVAPDASTTGSRTEQWLIKEGVLQEGAKYTCLELWKIAVARLKIKTPAEIRETLAKRLDPEEEPEQALSLYVEKVDTETNDATGEVKLSQDQREGEGTTVESSTQNCC